MVKLIIASLKCSLCPAPSQEAVGESRIGHLKVSLKCYTLPPTPPPIQVKSKFPMENLVARYVLT